MVTINQAERCRRGSKTPWTERIVRSTLEDIGKWKIERYKALREYLAKKLGEGFEKTDYATMFDRYEEIYKWTVREELNGKYNSSAKEELKQTETVFEAIETLKDKIEGEDDLYSIYRAANFHPQGVENILELAEFLEEEITPQNIEDYALTFNKGKVSPEHKEFFKRYGIKLGPGTGEFLLIPSKSAKKAAKMEEKRIEKLKDLCKRFGLSGDSVYYSTLYMVETNSEENELNEIFKRWQKILERYYEDPKEIRGILKSILFRKYSEGKEILYRIKEDPEILSNKRVTQIIKRVKEKNGKLSFLGEWLYNDTLVEFVRKVKEGKIEVDDCVEYPQAQSPYKGALSHYGRGRPSAFRNCIDMAPWYRGEKYVKALSSDDWKYKKDEKLNQIKNYKALRHELEVLSEKLKKWKKEGEELLNYAPKKVFAGFCVKYDGDIDIEEALEHKVNMDSGELKFLINRGFKAPSWFGKMVEEMVNELYEISEDAEKNPGVAYALNHWDELSDMERESFAERYESVRKMKELEQIKNAIEKYAKGVYFADPPMHSGNGGEDVDERNPRSYSMVERVFHRCDGYYVNVNEYFILRQDDEMRIRIYDFKRKPSRAEPSRAMVLLWRSKPMERKDF